MKRPHTGPVIICSCSYVWRAATLCVSGERDWLCQRGGDPRGNGLENQRDASDGKVSDVSGEKGQKGTDCDAATLLSSLLPICTRTWRCRRSFLARLHQKSDDKRDRRVRYGLDLHIAIAPPSLILFSLHSHPPMLQPVVYYDHKLISFNVD